MFEFCLRVATVRQIELVNVTDFSEDVIIPGSFCKKSLEVTMHCTSSNMSVIDTDLHFL